MNRNKILFVTTSQPSINPRLRKSADAIARAGHQVHVLYAYKTDWATVADEALLQHVPWTSQLIGGASDKQKLAFFWTRLTRKIWELLRVTHRGQCRGYSEFIRKGVLWNPDLVIGHNPGSLGVLVALKKRLSVPVIFDAEDFHRGEYAVGSIEYESVKKLEDSCIPVMDMATTASPLITSEYESIYKSVSWKTVNNAFDLKYQSKAPSAQDGPLKIVWFSQVVGLDRGLEEFIQGMNFIASVPIAFTIIGSISPAIQAKLTNALTSDNHRILFKDPIPESALFDELATHEIGLAIELPKVKNRELCRTNKLYSYPLSGLDMFLSKTLGQEQFLNEFPNTGTLIDLRNPSTIKTAIREAYEGREQLHAKRLKAWRLGKTTLNWENESTILLEAISKLLPA